MNRTEISYECVTGLLERTDEQLLCDARRQVAVGAYTATDNLCPKYVSWRRVDSKSDLRRRPANRLRSVVLNLMFALAIKARYAANMKAAICFLLQDAISDINGKICTLIFSSIETNSSRFL